MKCESCEKIFDNLIELIDGTSNYMICHNCLLKLVNLRLTPKNYKNLLKNSHDKNEFYLHGDFYDNNGEALQPK